MKRLIPRTLFFIPVVALAFTLAGCGAKHENENSSSLPSAEVRVQTVENKSRTMTEEVLGTVRAKLHATLEARLSGHIDQMPVALGEKIHKGQLIARLDAGEIVARLDQAKASLDLKQASCEADRPRGGFLISFNLGRSPFRRLFACWHVNVALTPALLTYLTHFSSFFVVRGHTSGILVPLSSALP